MTVNYIKQDFTFSNQWNKYNATISYQKHTENAPLVIFLHGFAAKKEYYTWIGEHLNRQGYAFINFDALIQFSNILTHSNQAPYQISKNGFISCIDTLHKSNNFKSVINLDFINVMGHSLGGLAALLAAQQDRRINSVIALSPPIDTHKSLPTPIKLNAPIQLQIGSYEGLMYNTVTRYYQKLQSPQKELTIIKGGNHIQYLDKIDTHLSQIGKIIWKIINTTGKLIYLPYIGSFKHDITQNQHHKISSQNFTNFLNKHNKPNN